jgi:hypothetical protein
MVVTF